MPPLSNIPHIITISPQKSYLCSYCRFPKPGDFLLAQLEEGVQKSCRFFLLPFLDVGVQRAQFSSVIYGRQCVKTHWRHVGIVCLHPSISKILLIHSSESNYCSHTRPIGYIQSGHLSIFSLQVLIHTYALCMWVSFLAFSFHVVNHNQSFMYMFLSPTPELSV